MTWQVKVVEPALSWLHELRRQDRETAQLVGAAIEVLKADGPGLGRPLVDTIKGSSIKNLKELRPGSSGSSEVRLLFVFDPEQQAVLLVAGDKSGQWKQWYRKAIAEAEAAYTDYLKEGNQP
ncbi:MAG: type II toxin-antitoxin system RelE/ParE family toxin [Candidatus Dormibacteraceae bacterium]